MDVQTPAACLLFAAPAEYAGRSRDRKVRAYSRGSFYFNLLVRFILFLLK